MSSLLRLQGRAANGQFKTAAAKEYTSPLCRALLVAMARGLKRRFETEGSRSDVQLTAVEQQWLENAWNASFQITREPFLPDYEGA